MVGGLFNFKYVLIFVFCVFVVCFGVVSASDAISVGVVNDTVVDDSVGVVNDTVVDDSVGVVNDAVVDDFKDDVLSSDGVGGFCDSFNVVSGFHNGDVEIVSSDGVGGFCDSFNVVSGFHSGDVEIVSSDGVGGFCDSFNVVSGFHSGDVGVVSSDDVDDVLTAEATNAIGSNNTLKATNEDILTDDSYSDLSDLSTLIKITPDKLDVSDDYKYTGTLLTIAKSNYVIDFHGHIIDGMSTTNNALTIIANNITIKNLKVINTKTGYDTGFIKIFGNDVTFDNLTTDNTICILRIESGSRDTLVNNSNIAHVGNRAILIQGESSKVLNSNFHCTNNVKTHMGVYVDVGGSADILNCNFNSSRVYAAANGNSFTFSFCNFTNTNNPAGVHCMGTVSNCRFVDCGAMSGNDGSIVGGTSGAAGWQLLNCTFIRCNAGSQYIIRSHSSVGTIDGCRFINCSTTDAWISNIAKISNCIFDYCDMKTFGPYIIENCTFNQVYYSSSSNGFISIGDTCIIRDTRFYRCSQAHPVIYTSNANAKIRLYNCEFTPSGEFDGWAITAVNSPSSKIYVENTNFNNITHYAIVPHVYDTNIRDIVYVNQTGGGDGSSIDTPTTINNALNIVDPEGIIFFINNGQTYNFNNMIIKTYGITIKGNDVTVNNNRAGYIFRTTGVVDSFIIKNFNFVNCGSSTSCYSPIYFEGGTHVSILNCNFTDCIGIAAGAIQFTSVGSHSITNKFLTIDNCSFTRNQATGHFSASDYTKYLGNTSAGAIFSLGTGTYITNCKFTDNTGLYVGAVLLYVYVGEGLVENCTFSGNKATTLNPTVNYSPVIGDTPSVHYFNAGALSFTRGFGDSRIVSCNFVNNSAPIAGAVYSYIGNVIDCNFINNSATDCADDGGAGIIYIERSYSNVVSCNFTNNTVTSSGGGVHVRADEVTVSDCIFTNNSAARGSAINLNGDSGYNHLNIVGCDFNGNKAINIGGVINTGTGHLIVSGCNFTGNVNGSIAVNNVVDGLSLNVCDCRFIRNVGVRGSAIYSMVATNIKASEFRDNVGTNGGAVYLTCDNSEIFNSSFINNQGLIGGAVYILGADNIIDSSRFVDNSAKSVSLGGGAVYVDADNLLVFDSYFTGNNATCYGGAIYIDGHNFYYVDNATRCFFNNNNALNKSGWPVGKNWNDIYDGEAEVYLHEVCVVLYPESIPNNNYTGDRDNPICFDDAFRVVAPGGSIIFINASEVHTEFKGSVLSGLFNAYQMQCNKYGVSFLGNDTYIVNLRFVVNTRAYELEFNNLTFMDCVGTPIIFYADDCLVDNCCFVGNGGDDCNSGGAIQVFGDNLLINNSVFIENKVFDDDPVGGGAIYCNASGLSIVNCTFDYNQANCGSSILLCEDCADILIKSSTFCNSSIVDSGVASIVVYCSSVNIRDSYFYNNVALGSGVSGGAILVEGSVFQIIIENNIFIHNYGSYGGAIAFNGNPGGRVYKNVFMDNVAVNGGALYLMGQICVEDSSFFNNSASNGSAIYIASLNNDVMNSFFASANYDENNNIILGYVYSSMEVGLKNNTLSFTDLNKVVSEADDNLDLEYYYKYFKEYDVPFKNGVRIDKTLNVNGHSFVLDGSNLARVFTVSGNNVKLINMTFINASNGNGGAVRVGGDGFNIFNVSFYNNTGVGALFLDSGVDGANIVDCCFVDNYQSSSAWSSGVHVQGINVVVLNCYFENNKGYAYSQNIDGSSVVLTRNVFINANSSSNGLRFTNKFSVSVYNNWWCSNNPSYKGSGSVLDSDPLQARLNFVSLTRDNGNYNYVFNVTFHNGNGDLIGVDWVRPVCYTVSNLTCVLGNVFGLNSNTGWSSSIALCNLSAVVDNQNLTPYLYPYLVLQYLIDYTNFTLDLCHDYTYSSVVDADNLPNGIVISKRLILEGNGYCIDGVCNGSCRVFYIVADNVVINNLTINNSKQLGESGGAIYWSGNYGVIANSSLINNGDDRWSYCRGGAFYWSGNCGVIDNCDFIGNSVGLGGSAIWLTGDYVNISFCNFSGGSSNGWGGTVVFNSAKYCSVSDCIFRNTVSAAFGGAVHQFNSDCDNLVVLNTLFINCYAGDSAGGLTVSSSGVFVYNCTFNGCFHNNYASSGDVYGGAVYWSGSNGRLVNSIFSGNYLRYQYSRGINAYGGAVCWSGFNGTLSYCNFTGNYIENGFSVRDGGAVYWSGSDGNIFRCDFSDHDVINGGAVYIGGSCLVNEDIFIGNCASNGGAVFVGGFALFNNSVFMGNSAVSGGAVYSSNNVTVICSDFVNNSGVSGGAIFLLDGYSTILNTSFYNNLGVNGSAIYVVTSISCWFNLGFIENVASVNATVYFREDSTVYSDNLSFVDNFIPNGLHVVGENHIYSPVLYVNLTHPGFGIILIEPVSLDWALDNILEGGKIILVSDCVVENFIEFSNLHNVTVIGNAHIIRKDKCLFILLT